MNRNFPSILFRFDLRWSFSLVFRCASLVICLEGIDASGAVVAPVITLNTTTVTKASLFSDSNYHPAGSVETSVDPDGFNRSHESATAWFQKTESYTVGSRTTDNAYAFESEALQRVTQTDSSFRFDATTTVNTSLDSHVRVSQSGNFYFITEVQFPSVFDLRRTVRFTVDQPMRLVIRFSGLSTNRGANFKNMFNFLTLSGGSFGISNRVLQFTSTNYTASPSTTFSGVGSKEGVNYALQGTADGSGIDLSMDLSPAIAGTSQALELRWVLPHTLDGGIAASVTGWDKVVSSSAFINESVIIAAIPEFSTVSLLTFSVTIACMSRARRR